jgi:hypothetical protein
MSWLQRLGFGKKEEDISHDPEKTVEEVKDEITGENVTWIVPEGMDKIMVRLYDSEGRFQKEYNITRWLTIRPGWKVNLKVVDYDKKTNTKSRSKSRSKPRDNRSLHDKVFGNV